MDLDNLTIYYGIFFFGTLFFSVLIYSLLLKFVRTLGVRNLEEHNMVRWSSQTKPSIGGLGFYIIFLLSFSALSIMPIESTGIASEQLFGIFAACTLGFFIGLADDAYDTNPLMKFIGQITCANILIAVDIFIPISPSLLFNYLFTVVWVVGMMNSLNMLDNMDGITSSVSASILIGAVAILLSTQGSSSFTFLCYGVLAALIGFLWFNWKPARMYMGDTGSMFLGVFLSVIGIFCFWGNKEPTTEFIQIKQFLVPLMAFLMPITDTITVFIRRIGRGQSPFVGGKDHTTHQLAFLGVSDSGVAAIFSFLSLIGISLAFWIHSSSANWGFGQSMTVIISYALFFGIVQVLYGIGKRKHEAAELIKSREEERIEFKREPKMEKAIVSKAPKLKIA